jgi:hypothetical protein
LNPSPAASALLASLALPTGAAAVWPTTRDGQVKLVVRLDRKYWERSKSIPQEFEGFSVVVEPNQPLAAQFSASGERHSLPKTFQH